MRRGGAAGFCGDHLGSWTLDGAEGLACLAGFWSLATVLFDIDGMMKGYVGGYSVWIDGMGCLHIGALRREPMMGQSASLA